MGGRTNATRTSKSSNFHPQLPCAGKAIEIAARHSLEPHTQGGLDALCGLYGTINALRLVMANQAPLTKTQCRWLFAAGVKFLERKSGFDAAAISGIETKRRLALARHLVKFVSITDGRIIIERPDRSALPSIDDVFAWMESSLAGGKPVLITLTGGLEHHTVIAGMTAATLQLFDSSGQRFIRKASCGLRAGYYQIPLPGLLRIAIERPR